MVRSSATEPTIPWIRIFTTRTFVTGVFLVMSVYAMSSVILAWLPSYFEVGLGYSRLQAGSMFAFPSITGLILMLLTSTIGDRLITRGVSSRRIRIVLPAIGVLVCGAFLLVLPAITSPALAVLVVSLGYGFASPVFTMLNAAIAENLPIAPNRRNSRSVFGAHGDRWTHRPLWHRTHRRRREHTGSRLRDVLSSPRCNRRGLCLARDSLGESRSSKALARAAR